jgi:hypothetical protein
MSTAAQKYRWMPPYQVLAEFFSHEKKYLSLLDKIKI